MPIDTHAHYVPPHLFDAARTRGAALGVSVRDGAAPSIAFAYGFATRPMFARLIEPVRDRRAWLDEQGIDRQLVATWPDMFGHGLAAPEGAGWHRMLNETLAEWTVEQSDRFDWIASVPLPHVEGSVAEFEWAADHGAVGLVLPANVEGTNIGELALDPLWARAAALGMPVLLHPVLVTPAPRASRFALAQTTQYTFDTTLGAASLLATGVLERFPGLRLMLSHGGGALPWLIGRFDIMDARMDRAAQKVISTRLPSDALRDLWLDTIVHHPAALRFLREVVGLDRMMLGTDYSFPPADLAPLLSFERAGFTPAEVRLISDEAPRALFSRLTKP